MAQRSTKTETRRVPLGPKIAGHIGLWLMVLYGLASIYLMVTSGRGPEDTRGARLLLGLLNLPVAALGVALFVGFLRLPDWTLAPEVPLGAKVLGHLGRVIGSLGAFGAVMLTVWTIVGLPKPAPGTTLLSVLMIFVWLLVRLLGCAVSELRRWARAGCFIGFGALLALDAVGLVLSLRVPWLREAAPAWGWGVSLGVTAVLYVFLLAYFMLPRVVEAFEARRL